MQKCKSFDKCKNAQFGGGFVRNAGAACRIANASATMRQRKPEGWGVRNQIVAGCLAATAVVLVRPAWSQNDGLRPITPEQCRMLEQSLGNAVGQLRRQMDVSNEMADTLKRVAPAFSERRSLAGEVDRVIVAMDASGAATRRMLEAFEDLQHELRLCGRGPR